MLSSALSAVGSPNCQPECSKLENFYLLPIVVEVQLELLAESSKVSIRNTPFSNFEVILLSTIALDSGKFLELSTG